MDYDLVIGTSNKELDLYLQCPYGRKWHPDQRGASGGGDVQKVLSRLSKRWKNVNVPQQQQEVLDAEDDMDKKKDTKEIKTKCSCRVISSRSDVDSPWKVAKNNLEHTGHTVPSKRAQTREKCVLKGELVTLIKAHRHLGLPPSTNYELLEKHFGEEFSNALTEPPDISNVYYKHGYKAATECQDLLSRLLAAKKNDPRWVVVPETEPGTNRLRHLFWMSPSQVEIAQRFNYLVVHDNTCNCNQFFHLGCFATINEHGQSLLTAQALVLRDRDCDYDRQLRQWLNNIPPAPKVLMTDANVACAKAVRSLLKKTRHLWCIWHIIENIRKRLVPKIGKHRYQAMMALFHDVRKECNEQILHRQWNALLDAYPDARDYLESTLGKEKCKYCATCYHWECFTAGIQSSQRGRNTNQWVKALCTKVRKHCSVNKIFDAVERLVKCQMRTQNRCLAIDDLKKTVTTVNKALPTVIPLVQASLTSYGLQRFLAQVDMGTTVYDVSSYNSRTVELIPPNGVDHAVYDGSPSHKFNGFVPPAEVQDRRMQTATVRVLPATGYAGMPQHVVFFDPMVGADDHRTGYGQFVCSCGHARFGQPCRHQLPLLHRGSILVFVHMRLFHEQWFL